MTMELNLNGPQQVVSDYIGTQRLAENNIKDNEDKFKVSELTKAESLTEETAKEKPKEKPKDVEVAELVDELNSMVSLMRKGLAFKIDDESGKQIVNVLDLDSGDIIRQIPNEEALELSQKLAEVAGFLLKTEA
ncbi:flagellar protein FlaG [Shewanella electrodiphila]|uniref:Flagellar protein FlaG n=1 Tax=Shewanella electrodiphila TaxID=934143 RepID=A0ABT0KMQ3_9GAMM|nr:flagellar protein FlaG [Shewanella electrodiphila]MCL1044816.1 flagellar protein FlaG [Shewanella electrodiphila]